MHYVRTVTIALVCGLAALAGGLYLGGHPQWLPRFAQDVFVDEDRALQAEITDKIEDSFYKPVDAERLRQRSLKGTVEALDDPFSQYLPPNEAQQFAQAVEGKFEGVGMTVDEDRRGLRVLNSFPGSPARKAGIRKGDLITAVNGRALAGVDSRVATGRIKGPAGTSVKLAVTTGSAKPRTVRVEREKIDIPLVESSLRERGGKKLGVVRLASFSSGAHGELRAAIDRLRARGAEGIVLDLRGNGGGLLREAVLVSSQFIEDGEIVSVRGRTRSNRTEEAQGDAIDQDIAVVVLVDGGSASASEITAGALRDRGRASLVGQRTFGKGLVQEVEPLSNGGVLDLTVAKYYLPSGKTIPLRKGLKPQVGARDKPRTARDEALPVALDELLKRVEQ
ncbi:MAG: S41 family peptidase [Actinomycetota bacterium]|nr:S41 family peptidase [Actinomycetota bacterium]